MHLWNILVENPVCFALYLVLKLRKAGEEKNTCLLVCRCLAADEGIFVVLQWGIFKGILLPDSATLYVVYRQFTVAF